MKDAMAGPAPAAGRSGSAPAASRGRAGALVPLLLGSGWTLALLHSLLSPGRALSTRDVPLFQLPLRVAFARLAAAGAPVWNPWIHGGQPVLSNPNYAAFYPPTWLVLAVPPHYALSLQALLHFGIAFAGAWVLARRLGAGRSAAALAALAWSGGGASLSLLSAFNLFCGSAWIPWVLAGGDAAIRAASARRASAPAIWGGLALGLQLLNGEPATVVLAGLGLLALAAAAARRRPLPAARAVLLLVTVGIAVAAVQVLPALDRLADSPRAGGLTPTLANLWSSPPVRWVELVFPRFFGDPARDEEGLFFSWGLHDKNYPYVISIYPGFLLTLLGVSALLRWPVPRRWAWGLALAAGLFLAPGRHNPVYEPLRRSLPVLRNLRFPEKFLLLAILALVFAGALGWQRLLAERRAGRPEAADLPLVLALVALATAAGLTALLHFAPDAGAWFIHQHAPPRIAPEAIAAGLRFLRGEGLRAVLFAAASAALLALCRHPRTSERLLAAAAPALLAADLWTYGHGLVRTIPAAEYLEPPPLARPLLGRGDRVFSEFEWTRRPDYVPLRGEPSLFQRTLLYRLDPYSGVLWGLSYALDRDYDLTLSAWARHAVAQLEADWNRKGMLYRFLGVWNVGTLLTRKPTEEQLREIEAGGTQPARPLANPYVLPRYRFVPRVTLYPAVEPAVAAARAGGWAVASHERWVRQGGAEETRACPSRPVILELADSGGQIRLRYRAATPAFFVVAMTYERGWSAAVDGRPLATYPTAAGQLGVALPEGEHRLRLDYRTTGVRAGAAVSLAALAACAAGLAVARRERTRPLA